MQGRPQTGQPCVTSAISEKGHTQALRNIKVFDVQLANPWHEQFEDADWLTCRAVTTLDFTAIHITIRISKNIVFILYTY